MTEHEMRERMAVEFSGACFRASQEAIGVIQNYGAPSVMFRPTLSVDGDQWCALYGPNLQEGVAGFGASPSAAMCAFDLAWSTSVRATP